MAVWMPVMSVPTSSATVAMATFITEVSSVIRNWPAASVARTSDAPARASGGRSSGMVAGEGRVADLAHGPADRAQRDAADDEADADEQRKRREADVRV